MFCCKTNACSNQSSKHRDLFYGLFHIYEVCPWILTVQRFQSSREIVGVQMNARGWCLWHSWLFLYSLLFPSPSSSHSHSTLHPLTCSHLKASEGLFWHLIYLLYSAISYWMNVVEAPHCSCRPMWTRAARLLLGSHWQESQQTPPHSSLWIHEHCAV